MTFSSPANATAIRIFRIREANAEPLQEPALGGQGRAYHPIPTGTKVAIAAIHLSLTALLIVGVAETYVPRTF
jgi:hypothetical protein